MFHFEQEKHIYSKLTTKLFNIFEREKYMCFVVVVMLLHKKTESVRILADATIDVWCLFQIDVLV